MRAWAAAGTAVLQHKDPSFSSNASIYEISHNSLCRLTNYLFSHWKALTVLPPWVSKSQIQGRSRTWENCECGQDNGTRGKVRRNLFKITVINQKRTDSLSTQLVVLTNHISFAFPTITLSTRLLEAIKTLYLLLVYTEIWNYFQWQNAGLSALTGIQEVWDISINRCCEWVLLLHCSQNSRWTLLKSLSDLLGRASA